MKRRFYVAGACLLLISFYQTVVSANNYQSDMVSENGVDRMRGIIKKINFVVKGSRMTPNPEGWEEYDGSIYSGSRGYGWLTDLAGNGRDRGQYAAIELHDGTITSPAEAGRLELSNMQGAHFDNVPMVFRIDLPDGWYRVTCASVNPGGPLPVVDQRSFKCRSHDVVFAGANFGAPLAVKGNFLIEGTGLVEVTDAHLRIVVGDPAYAGWSWRHSGTWYQGWVRWIVKDHIYAKGVSNKLKRVVDEGFHSIRMNSLIIEKAEPPSVDDRIVFRDYFNRENSDDLNQGKIEQHRWIEAVHEGDMKIDLYQTSIRYRAPGSGTNITRLYQDRTSPESGVIRYSTRVSLSMGVGMRISSGRQEAGIFILADPSGPQEFNSTFIGVLLNVGGSGQAGGLVYRVGDGKNGYRTNTIIPDSVLPYSMSEGEYEIVADHDVERDTINSFRVNGIEVIGKLTSEERSQRIDRGLFGIRGAIEDESDISQQQFYWYYRVEIVG